MLANRPPPGKASVPILSALLDREITGFIRRATPMSSVHRYASPILAVIIAALVAVAAHAILAALPGHAESTYRHVAVSPLFSLGLSGIGIFLGVASYRGLAARDKRTAAAAIARAVIALPWGRMCAAIFFVAVVIFALGESLEQMLSLGHLVPTAMGFGSALFFLTVALCTVVATACARALFTGILTALACVVARLCPLHVTREGSAPVPYHAPVFVLPSQRLASANSPRRGPPAVPVPN